MREIRHDFYLSVIMQNAIPEDYAQLGLQEHELERHVAWDMGAAEVTRHLADILGCPAILSGFQDC